MEFLRKLGSRLGFGSRDEDEEKKRRSRARQTSRPSARSMVQTTRPQPSRSSQQPSQTFDTSQPLAKVPDVTQPPQKSDNQRRIEELRKEVEQDGRPEWRQRFNFDANSPYSRLQRLEDGRQEMYADSLDKDENRRVFGEQQNAAQAMFGDAAQLANTVRARGSELPETLIGAYHQARGNDEALRKSLDIQRDTRDRLYQGNDGLLGVGTIYDDENEVAGLGVGETSKRIGAGLLSAGSIGVGGVGKTVIQQGARQGMRSLASGQGARELGKMSLGGAAGTGGYELATNRDVTPGSFAGASAVGGAFGPVAGVGLAGVGRGASRVGGSVASRLSKADAPTIPGSSRTPSPEPKADVGAGIKSTNLVKAADTPQAGGGRVQLLDPSDAPAPPPGSFMRAIDDAATPQRGGVPPRVPDASNPIALAKVDDPTLNPVASTPSSTPMANFRDSVDGSALRKVVDDVDLQTSDAADAVQAGRLQSEAGVDAQGNPVMMNDAQAAQQLADLGIAPGRGSSPVGASEQAMAAGRAQDASAQTSRITEQLASEATDPDLQAQLRATQGYRGTFDIEVAQARSGERLRGMDDNSVIRTFDDNYTIETPDEFIFAKNAFHRLDDARIRARESGDQATMDAVDASIGRLTQAMDEWGNRHGVGLNIIRTLYENMSATQKTNYLLKAYKQKLGRELNNDERLRLQEIMDQSDVAAKNRAQIEDEVRGIIDDLEVGTARGDRATLDAVNNYKKQIDELRLAENEYFAQANRFLADISRDTLGERTVGDVGHFGRMAMLSAPSGRAFDVQSTSMTALSDIGVQNWEALLGKAVNARKGAGTVRDTFVNPRKFASAGRDRLRQTWGDAVTGRESSATPNDYIRNINRGDLGRRGRLTDLIRAGVSTADSATYGRRTEAMRGELTRIGKQKGLKGDDLDVYVAANEAATPPEVLRWADQEWRKTNMMHDNKFTNALAKFSRSMETSFADGNANVAQRALGGLVKNAVLPFSRFAGGYAQRLVKDKNYIGNVAQFTRAQRNGDVQGMVNASAKFAQNSVEAFGLGTLLYSSGLLSETNASGDSWDGLYLEVGDRQIPVAILGVMAPNVIAGWAMNKAIDEVQDGADFSEAFMNNTVNALGRMFQSSTIGSTLGGRNHLMDTINNVSQTVSRGGDDAEMGRRVMDSIAQGTLRMAGQYLNPSVFRDVNAITDSMSGANARDIEETRTSAAGNEVRDVRGTEWNRLLSNIPGVRNLLPESGDEPSRNWFDRAQRATTGTPEQMDEKRYNESVRDMERRLKRENIPLDNKSINDAIDRGDFESAIQGREYELFKAQEDPNSTVADVQRAEVRLTEAQLQSEGVPLDNDSMKARQEEGAYDLVGRGLEHELSLIEDDPDIPESKKDKLRGEIARNQVYQEGEWDPQIVSGYENGTASTGGIGVTDWRDMMDSGDPEAVELAESLYELDQQLLEAGIIDEPKYYWGKGGRGGRGGRGGGSRMSTNIATLSSPGFTYSPIKVQQANMSAPQSAIPELEKVPNYDDSRLRKISVTRGGRR